MKVIGSALITALFIMCLVAIAATALSYRLQIDIYRTDLMIKQAKLSLAAEFIKFWAISRLADKEPLRIAKNVEGKLLDFPAQLRPNYPQIQLTGALFDAQAHFNINNLRQQKYHRFFLNLLKAHHISEKKAQKTLQGIANSIGATLQPLPSHSNRTAFAEKRNFPLQPSSHELLQSLSELKLIPTMNPTLLAKIEPWLVALPEMTPLNLHTAPGQMLRNLGDGLSEQQVNKLLMLRTKSKILSWKQLEKILEKYNIPPGQVSLESEYFVVRAFAKLENLNLAVNTLLKRKKEKNDHYVVTVIHEWFS